MKKIILCLLLGSILPDFGPFAKADENGGVLIKVGDAKIKKSLLAVPAFVFLGTPTGGASFREIGNTLFNTTHTDLEVSSYFQFIKPDAFLEDVTKIGLKPVDEEANGFHYDQWKKIGTEFLLRCGFYLPAGSVELECYLYHVPQAKLLLGKRYKANSSEVRKLAHTLSNDILKTLTGNIGMFTSQFVVSSDRAAKSTKEIYLMDWDGFGPTKVTNHQSISISPNWSPDASSIVYTSFAYHKNNKQRNADLFSYELKSGKRFLVSHRKGINSGATFTPDGKRIFLTVSQSGNPDIFSVNSDGEDLKQITNGPLGAMNVEPAISPDGKKVAFSSDRSGKPMLYVMNIDGGDARRVTFAGKYNATPAWSPDGKKIAFSGWDENHFDIFIMNQEGTGLERLTSAKKPNGKPANNEDASFSPDGRHLVFTSNRTGSNQVYIMNIDGTNERRITVDKFNYFKPKWSSNL